MTEVSIWVKKKAPYLLHLDRSTFAKFWRKPLKVLIQKLSAQLVSAMFTVDVTMQIYSELETFKQS